MENDNNKVIEKKFDLMIGLLQNLLAIELWKNGVKQEEIGKRLRIAKATVGEMLKGVKQEK